MSGGKLIVSVWGEVGFCCYRRRFLVDCWRYANVDVNFWYLWHL